MTPCKKEEIESNVEQSDIVQEMQCRMECGGPLGLLHGMEQSGDYIR